MTDTYRPVRRNWTDDMDAQMMEHISLGKTFTVIAAEMNISKNMIAGRFSRLRKDMGSQAV